LDDDLVRFSLYYFAVNKIKKKKNYNEGTVLFKKLVYATIGERFNFILAIKLFLKIQEVQTATRNMKTILFVNFRVFIYK